MPTVLATPQVPVAPSHLAAPDLSIRIELKHDPEALIEQSLWFELTARAPELGLNGKPFGPLRLRTEPQIYLERVFGKIALPGRQASEELASLGSELARELLPQDLHQLLWELRGKAETLWIQSEELWIPWEILKLRGKNNGRWEPGPFLCEGFALTRWPLGMPWWGHLPLSRIALVLANSPDLEALGAERELLEKLCGPQREVEVLPSNRHEILIAMETTGFDGWHFAGHGVWRQSNLRTTGIMLDGKEELRPDDVEHDAPNFGAAHPFVFLNACHQGRESQGLVHWQGWAARLTEMGAGAFLGASWATKDRPALEFARTFYSSFLAGLPLAEAVRQARLEIHQAFPEDITWLAYTAFGYSTAICAKPSEAIRQLAAVEARPPVVRQPLGNPESTRDSPRGPRRRMSARLRWASASAALSLALFLVLAFWRTPTRIHLEVPVEQLSFTVSGIKTQPLLDTDLFAFYITLNGFARLGLQPAELSRQDSAGNWQPTIVPTEGITLVARDVGTQVSISPGEQKAQDGAVASLDRLWVKPGAHVTLGADRSSEGFDLRFRFSSVEPPYMTLLNHFQLSADSVEVRGLGGGSGLSLRLRGQPRPGNQNLQIFPANGSFGLAVVLATSAAKEPLLSRSLAIEDLRFLEQDSDGEPRSTVRDAGQISFPDQHWKSSVAITAGEFVKTAPVDSFQLNSLKLEPKTGLLKVVVTGVARQVLSGPSGSVRDHRPSLYEKLLRSQLDGWLAALVAGSMGLGLGLRELWRRLIAGSH